MRTPSAHTGAVCKCRLAGKTLRQTRALHKARAASINVCSPLHALDCRTPGGQAAPSTNTNLHSATHAQRRGKHARSTNCRF
eukprot:15484436-Alexandrium_andersonii.AAC.1